MREQKSRIEELATKYWAATLTSSEEQELRTLLATDEEFGEEIEALRIMLGAYEVMIEKFEEDLDLGEYDKLPAANNRNIASIVIGSIGVAAAVAIGIFVYIGKASPVIDDTSIYCYINGEPITSLELALDQMKYLEPLAEMSETIITIESHLNQ